MESKNNVFNHLQAIDRNLDKKGRMQIPIKMLRELGVENKGKMCVVKYKDEDFIRIYKGE